MGRRCGVAARLGAHDTKAGRGDALGDWIEFVGIPS
jgi:hypothetical protein